MDSAKIFKTGRSQAVRLPKAYRFDSNEVLIERQPDGAVLLRPKPKLPLGERIRAILQGLPDDPSFERPKQPPLVRTDETAARPRNRARAARNAGPMR